MSAGRQLIAAVHAAWLETVQERAWIVALPATTAAATALLAPSYADTYRTQADLARAVASAQNAETMRFLYGTLSPTAGIVQSAVWELGALTCLALGIVVTLRATARSRGDEDLGRAELLHSVGAGPGARLAAQAMALALECLLLGAAAGVGLLALDTTEGADAAAYGAAVTGTCLLLTCSTLVVAQLVQDAAGTRVLSLSLLGLLFVGYGLRASQDWGWAGWVSPFRLRAAIDPGGENSWTPCLWAIGGCIVLIGAAIALAAHRDLGLGVLRLRGPWSGRRLHVTGPLSLTLELRSGQCLAWAATTALVTGLLVSMGEGVVDLVRQGAVSDDSPLGSLMEGKDAGRAFLAYVGAIAGALAAGQAISLVSRYGADEIAGRLEAAHATGIRPWRLLLSWWLTASLGAGLSLAAAALVAGFLGDSALDTDAWDALRLVGGQWPAAIAAAGLTAGLCGSAPRWRGLTWVPVLAGLGITQLGGVLGLSQKVRDAAPFAQAGESGSPWLILIALVCLGAGALRVEQRDIELPASGRGLPASLLPTTQRRR